MTHHTPPTEPLDLDDIEARANPAAHDRQDVLTLVNEVRRLRAELIAEQSQHVFTLRQRNLRSRRLLHLRDLALAGDTEALTAAAKDVLAASVYGHKHGGAAAPAAVETDA
jgi:hypothetical protein